MAEKTSTSGGKTSAKPSPKRGSARPKPARAAATRSGASKQREAKPQAPQNQSTARGSTAGAKPKARTQSQPRAGQGGRGKPKSLPINPFVALLAGLKRDVETGLSDLFAPELERALKLGSDPHDMVLACRDLSLRGGKRVRPGFVVAGFRCASASRDITAAVRVGVALELVQTYFLIHDDWMDQDLVRRGGPSVHAELTRRFRSEHLGSASAILAGDYAVALAQRVIATTGVPQRTQLQFLSTFAEMQVDAVLGQQLDLLGKAGDPEVTYALKTASYTVRGPLLLGALLGGAKPATLTALSRFATPAGVAFQLRDDLLGVFGSPKETGKPAGSDLTAGKRTPLVLAGFRRAKGKGHRLLKRVFGDPSASTADITRAVEVLDGCGARASVEARITELEAAATSALNVAPAAGAGKPLRAAGRELLLGATRALASRRS